MLDLKAVEDVKACTNGQKPIYLDGQVNMKIKFDRKEITTTVYIKLVAPDQFLLSEKVCHLLGIVNYHPSVKYVDRCQPIADVSCAKQHKESSNSEDESGLWSLNTTIHN